MTASPSNALIKPNDMKTKTFLDKILIGGASLWMAGSMAASQAQATVLTLASSADTLAAAVGPAGTSSAAQLARLDTPDLTGLTFSPALVGGFGTNTAAPTGAPAGTQVLNIAPGDGENGYFMLTFTLPVGFSGISLTGAANVDDTGRAFLNGNALSASIVSGSSGVLNQFDSRSFSTANAAFFQAGTNTLLISDANSQGGPSGAAFYATVSFVPEPSTWALLGLGAAGMALRLRRRVARA